MSAPDPSAAAGSAPDRWIVIEVPAPPDEDRAALLIDELATLVGHGVEERGDRILAYLPDPGDGGDRILEELRARLGDVDNGAALTHRFQPHEAWDEIWREGLAPRRVTPRIVVSPTWEDPPLEPGDILISIDPGMAFGTAEHPTTRGVLRLMDGLVEPGDRIADVGAGSGILSIAAALLGADRVVALEMDRWSCAAARENVVANGVADRVEVRHEAADAVFLPDEPSFDGILANIECGVLSPLLPGFYGGLEPGGWLIASGILHHERDAFIADARDAGFTLVSEDREETWWSGLLRHRRPGRPDAS